MEETMAEGKSRVDVGRRQFLGGAGVAGAAAAAAHALTPVAPASAQAPGQTASPAITTPQPAGYTFFQPQEALFIEAVADHMIPKDELTPSGTDIGLATFIDRALAGSWGKGDRLYMQGPWQRGSANQGYQLPLTPAQLYRAAIAGCNAHCRTAYKQTFDRCTSEQKEAFLRELSSGKITLAGGLAGRAFFDVLYQNVIEGMFSDPIYGGNRDKIGWKMIGFPGVAANNAENVKQYNNGRRFPANPVGIADMS
jgi:gluconate 2-dehydrogenase gamma chain